jgi:hypothetical protein
MLVGTRICTLILYVFSISIKGLVNLIYLVIFIYYKLFPGPVFS